MPVIAIESEPLEKEVLYSMLAAAENAKRRQVHAHTLFFARSNSGEQHTERDWSDQQYADQLRPIIAEESGAQQPVGILIRHHEAIAHVMAAAIDFQKKQIVFHDPEYSTKRGFHVKEVPQSIQAVFKAMPELQGFSYHDAYAAQQSVHGKNCVKYSEMAITHWHANGVDAPLPSVYHAPNEHDHLFVSDQLHKLYGFILHDLTGKDKNAALKTLGDMFPNKEDMEKTVIHRYRDHPDKVGALLVDMKKRLPEGHPLSQFRHDHDGALKEYIQENHDSPLPTAGNRTAINMRNITHTQFGAPLEKLITLDTAQMNEAFKKDAQHNPLSIHFAKHGMESAAIAVIDHVHANHPLQEVADYLARADQQGKTVQHWAVSQNLHALTAKLMAIAAEYAKTEAPLTPPSTLLTHPTLESPARSRGRSI